jgi:putative transcriptional regulator
VAKGKQSNTDFERLLAGVEEMSESEDSGSTKGRSSEYVGQVLVRVREGRKTVWTLDGAAQELRAVLEKKKLASFGDTVSLARQVLRQSQEGFAALLGISTSTLQGWEQGRRVPQGPAQTLLMVTMKHPQEVLDTVTDKSYAVRR